MRRKQMIAIKNYRVGEKITVTQKIKEGHEDRYITVKVKVKGVYKHHILVENSKGTRWCITNAELYTTEMEKRYGGNMDKELALDYRQPYHCAFHK